MLKSENGVVLISDEEQLSTTQEEADTRNILHMKHSFESPRSPKHHYHFSRYMCYNPFVLFECLHQVKFLPYYGIN